MPQTDTVSRRAQCLRGRALPEARNSQTARLERHRGGADLQASVLESPVTQIQAGVAYGAAPVGHSDTETQAHGAISKITGSKYVPEVRLVQVLEMHYSANTTI